jgi:hypothetical protein
VRLIAGNLSCVRTEKRQRCSPGRAWQRVDRLQAAQAADVADGLVATQYALFDGVAQTAELRRVAEQHAWILMASPLCLLKTPKAARGLEFRDSPPYCRQHVQTHAFIVAVLGRRFRSRAVLQLENLALRHQLHVLRRQRPGRLRLFTIDRLLWVWLYRLWPRCLDTMMLVKPATVIQWHRQGFRLYWRWRSRSGRPSADREDSQADS